MKNLLKTLKFLFINTLIVSLMQNTFIDSALAAGNKSSGGWEANDIMNIANGTLGIYASYLGQKQMMMQQQIMNTTNQRLMAQMSPSCRKPDGTACFSTQGKYFPECTLPASMSNTPKNVCTSATPEPGQISNMITYEAIANGWVNYYDQMSNKASNAAYPVGLRCLEDKQKALDAQLTEMVNNLQRLQDRLNQDKQIFRDNNKKLLEEMNLAKEELFGGSKDLNSKTRDFAKYFSQNCQSIIGKEKIANGTASGLNGILQNLSSENKAAADFTMNKAIIENDIRREADKISNSIASRGVGDWMEGLKTNPAELGASGMPGLAQAAGKQLAEFDTSLKRITKTLAEVGYTAPPMDKNFTADMDEFMASSSDFFKKKYVHDCVTGADKGIAIPVEDILKSLEQKRTRSGGTVTMDYRVALKKILDSDAMMDKKMAMIKDLEAQYPGMTITYKASNQTTVTESPYNLFMKTIEKCEERYVQDDQFSTKGGSKGVSYQKKVERARAALAELKNLNDTFASRVNQAIVGQMLSCNGEEAKSGAACSEETMKPLSQGFCVAHASKCSNDIQGCYAEANNHVQTRKAKMENLAKRFNANVAAMIANTNNLYEQQKMAVTNITKMIQSRFPGVNFEIPKDMFVPMPEMKKDEYGVEMAENGNLAAILDGEGSMPVKIEKLKDMFKKQRDKVNNEISNYIALQEAAMQKNRSSWEQLASDCKGAIDQSSKSLAQMNQEGMKKQAELDQKVLKFCKKYDSIRENPVGGCGKAKDLAELSDEIAVRLTNQTTALTEQYAAACDGFNNESDNQKNMCRTEEAGKVNYYHCSNPNSAEKKEEKKKMPLYKLCGDGEVDDKEFIATVAKKLSTDDQEKLKDATNLESIKKVSRSMDNADFFMAVRGLVTDSNTSICKQLTAIEQDTSSEALAKEKQSAQKSVDNAKKALKTAEEKLSGAKTDQEKSDANADKKAAASKVEEAEKLVAEVDEKISGHKGAKNKKNLDDALTELASLSAGKNMTADDVKLTTLTNLGEKMDGPCDMQSNSGMSKGLDMQNFLRNHDMGVLGINR